MSRSGPYETDFAARDECMREARSATYPLRPCWRLEEDLLVNILGEKALVVNLSSELILPDPALQAHGEHPEREEGRSGRCRLSSKQLWTARFFGTICLSAAFVLLGRKASYSYHNLLIREGCNPPPVAWLLLLIDRLVRVARHPRSGGSAISWSRRKLLIRAVCASEGAEGAPPATRA